MSLDKIIVQYDAEIKELRKEVESLKKTNLEIESSAKKAGKSYTDMQTQVKGGLTSAFKGLGIAIAAAFSIQRIGAFIVSTIELAREAEEVRRVFDKLNNPQLLSELRRAVSGTVGDLALMKAAIKAENFKIPLQDLAKLFQFAKIKADETGQSVESLADIIITAVGRNSTRALVELGISQADINKKVKETGSLYQGMVSIIDQAVAEAGPDIDSMADKQDRLRASIENTKIELGEKFLPLIASFLDGLNYTTQQIMDLFDKTAKKEEEGAADRVRLYKDHGNEIRDIVSNHFGDFVRSLGDMTKLSNEEIIKLSNEAKKELERNIPDISAASSDEFKVVAEGLKSSINAITNYTQQVLKARESNKALTDEENTNTKAKVDNVKAINDYVKSFVTLEPYMIGFTDELNRMSKEEREAVILFHELADIVMPELGRAVRGHTKDVEDSTHATQQFGEETDDSTAEALDNWNAFAQEFSSLIHGVNEAFTTGSDYRLSILQDELDRGIISQKQYDIQSRKLKRDEAIRDKAVGAYDVIINTARAIMAYNAEGNALLAVLAGIQGAVALGTILATPLPAFKKGKVMINGDGTETSDSILARISKNESIINARSTRKYKGMLEAINEDRVDKYLMNVYFKEKKQTPVGSDADYREFLELKRLGYINKNGFSDVVRAIKDNRQYARF